MGTLYDREKLVDYCGTKTDACRMDWAGMIVTQPAIVPGSGDPMVVIPTFMPDQTHSAGVFGVRITEASGTPQFAIAWRAPEGAAALTRFRLHPSRPVVASPLTGDAPFAFVVESNIDRLGDGVGHLVAVRTSDGLFAADAPLSGPGQRFVLPVTHGNSVYLPSCESDSGPSRLEAYDFEKK
jgi:hypothetical protein